MTEDDEKDFQKSNRCHICGNGYNKRLNFRKPSKKISGYIHGYWSLEQIRKYDEARDKENRKVRDHCHITGKYRGSAHSACNLKLKLS